jgi:hypothetical protein
VQRTAFLLSACITIIPCLVFATDFSGSVVAVLDGDTIEVLHNARAERIRLNGIDCPEKGHAYGKRIIPGRPYKQKEELVGRGHHFSDHLRQDQGSDYCQTEVVIRGRG